MRLQRMWMLLVGCLLVVGVSGCPSTPPNQPPKADPSQADTQTSKLLAGQDIVTSIGMTLVEIPAGEFMMGSPDSGSDDNEKPQHRVRITKPFYLGVTEVMQAQYEKVMGKNPSYFKESHPDAPVENVSWADAREFCRKLSELAAEREAGRRYRLPTEAQWEYACRAGSPEKYCYGDGESRLGDYAWYMENSDGRTHQVGQKTANAWGLYDMHGNVWEWCADWYDSDEYYANSPMDDPTGPKVASERVSRGGGWYYSARNCRSAGRAGSTPGGRSDSLGLRVCLVPADR